MRDPLVTVAMPLYNGAATVERATRSILAQTHANFELLIIDDGSSDDSLALVQTIADPRVRILRHGENQGLAATRNDFIDHARGRYIAWLDQDDWSHPERLERQLAPFLADHRLIIVGTWAKIIFETRGTPTERAAQILFERGFTGNAAIRSTLAFRNCFATSSVMLDVLRVREAGFRFVEERAPAEDYDMWTRLTDVGSAAIVPMELTRIWEMESGASAAGRERQQRGARAVRVDLLTRGGLQLEPDDVAAHHLVCELSPRSSPPEIERAVMWLNTLHQWNSRTGYFDRNAFALACSERVALAIRYIGPRNTRKVTSLLQGSTLARHVPMWLARRVARAAIPRYTNS